MGDLFVTSITHEETWPLRQMVLRPEGDRSACQWPGDTDSQTKHYAAKVGDETVGEIVGIGSLYEVGHRCAPGPDAWQLRGMAVHPQHRGAKIGRRLLTHMIDDAQKRLGAKTLWCNARLRALTLYARFGFEFASDTFEIEGVGPHRVMRLILS